MERIAAVEQPGGAASSGGGPAILDLLPRRPPMPRSTGLNNPYSVHPGVLSTQAWIQTLPEKTGRSLEEWLRLVQEEGPPTEKERRDYFARLPSRAVGPHHPGPLLPASPPAAGRRGSG